MIKNNYGLLSAVYFYSKCYFLSSSYSIKSGSDWQDVELDTYNDVMEMRMDHEEVPVSSTHCATEAPC